MKHLLPLFITALFLTSQPARAASDPAQSHYESDLRLGWISQQAGNDQLTTLATAGRIALATHPHPHLSVRIAAFGVLPAPSDAPEAHPDFVGTRQTGFLYPGEASIGWRQGALAAEAGHIRIETPHADSDDIRLLPNRFRGLALHWHQDGEWSFHGGWIDAMSGWDNGERIDRFINLGKVLGTDEDIAGMAFAGLSTETPNGGLIEAWGYHITDVANLGLLQGHSDVGIGNGWKLHLFAQLEAQKAIGRGLSGPLDAQVGGLSLGLDHEQTSINLAFNAAWGDGTPLTGFGAGPYPTYMELLALQTGDEQVRAAVARIGYAFAPSHIAGAQALLAHGALTGRNGGVDFRRSETDLILVLTLTPELEFDLTHAYLTDDRPGIPSERLWLWRLHWTPGRG